MNLLTLPKEKLKQVRAQDHVLEGKEGSKRNVSLILCVPLPEERVQR